MSLDAQEDVLEVEHPYESMIEDSRSPYEQDADRLNIAMSFSLIAKEGLKEPNSYGQANAMLTISGPYAQQGFCDMTKLLFQNQINIISDFGTRIHRKMHSGNFWISGEPCDLERLKADIKARGAKEITFEKCDDDDTTLGDIYPINITCPDAPGVYHQIADIISKHGALILMHQSDTFLRGDDSYGRIRLKIEIPTSHHTTIETIMENLSSHGRLLGWTIDQAPTATDSKLSKPRPSRN